MHDLRCFVNIFSAKKHTHIFSTLDEAEKAYFQLDFHFIFICVTNNFIGLFPYNRRNDFRRNANFSVYKHSRLFLPETSDFEI